MIKCSEPLLKLQQFGKALQEIGTVLEEVGCALAKIKSKPNED